MAIRWEAPLTSTDPFHGGAQDFVSFEGFDRSRQAQVVAGPIPDWKALRLEVKFGDEDPRYSDQRALLSGNEPAIDVHEGAETWTRWCAMWPADWQGAYPKWDELNSWPTIRHDGGSNGEWHHAPNNNDWANFGGSAPIYIGANEKDIWLELVEQSTSESKPGYPKALTPLLREHWHEFMVHGKWSTDPTVGFLEIWVDGKNVFPKQNVATLYPDCYNYFLIGLYRNFNIGGQIDQNGNKLVWPNGPRPGVTYPPDYVPVQGQLVWPKGDGCPQHMFITGMIIGDTQADVMDAYPSLNLSAPTPTPTPMPTLQPPPTAQDLMDQRAKLQSIILQADAVVASAQQTSAAAAVMVALITAKLDKGPWT